MKDVLEILANQAELLEQLVHKQAEYGSHVALRDLNEHRNNEHTLNLRHIKEWGGVERRIYLATELDALRQKFAEGQRDLREALAKLS